MAIKGKVNRRDTGSLSVVVFDMALLEINDTNSAGGRPLMIKLKDTSVTTEQTERLKEVLLRHTGKTEVRITLGRHLLRLAHQVDVTPALLADLKALVGAGNVS